ncbi:MAG: serine protease [Paludibacter sp.]|jgi:hypothetical protein|nr:serine protease [Paludibacter sp.]
MMDLYVSLPPALKFYWSIALFASLIFVIQAIITLIGIDSNSDFDADTDADADGFSQFFSFRNLINFLLGLGWGGVCFYNVVNSNILLILLATLTGLAFLFLFFFLLKAILKLNSDRSFRFDETIGKTAEVYLTIPENKSDKGKIQISVRGSFHELNAITAGEKIVSGALVKVINVHNGDVVEVEKI